MTRSFSDFAGLFIRRPVLALVINALIVVAGLAAYNALEVRELPAVDRPVITVSTSYPGAAPEVVDTEVTARIESAVARVPGVLSLSSWSRLGTSRVAADFSTATDLDVAANDMRDAVARIRNSLPRDINEPRIVKADTDGEAIIRLSVTAPALTIEALTTLVEDRIVDRLAAIDGVADVQVMGGRLPVVRVDIDQTALAARGLTVGHIASALGNVTFDAPAGSLSNTAQSLVVRANARLGSAEEIAAVMLDRRTRLDDVATVTLGPDAGTARLRIDGEIAVGLGIIRAAGANTIAISDAVQKIVAELIPTLPAGVAISTTLDDALFIKGALNEVVSALIIAVAIVVAVMFLFLGEARATLIPALTIPVALAGTLAAMWLVGFSLNILTLLALVLATGLVVDDAIVVLENIMRWRALGVKPYAAAALATREVFFAVLATTATLAAVFVPISFLPDILGALFREFGFVLAIAVLISSLTALTLVPMLAAFTLPERSRKRGVRFRVSKSLESIFRKTAGSFSALFMKLLRGALKVPLFVSGVSLLFGFGAVIAFSALRLELTPPEDRGAIFFSVSAPPGASTDYTASQLDKMVALLQPYVEHDEGTAILSMAGRGSANAGFVVMTLADWNARERSQREIVQEINQKLGALPGVRAFALSGNSLGIRGGGQGLRFALTGPTTYEDLIEKGETLVAAMEDNEAFRNPRLDFETTQPQLSVVIDRTRAHDLGVTFSSLGPALQAVLDGRQVAELTAGSRAIPVKLVSTAVPVDDPKDIEDLFVRTGDGRMVPMAAIATLREEAVAPSLQREGQQRAVPIVTEPAEDGTIGEALESARALTRALLPGDYRLVPLGDAAALEETTQGFLLTFAFAVVIILLVLAAQFESFILGLIIFITVPFGLASAVYAILLSGGSLNIYSQIGLIMLIGIMAKNGILIIEFANQLRDQGFNVARAIEEACRIRLRPVMMTMISTIAGAVPLLLAFGAGAEARIALGQVLVLGLGFATVFTLFLTPVAYRLLAGLVRPPGHVGVKLSRQLREAEKVSSAES